MPDAFGSPSCIDRSAESLCGFVESTVDAGIAGSLLIDWSGYAGLGKRGYEHFAVAECGAPEVAEQYLPISHLVAFANLKTWLIGIHHGVSHQHLQAYLNEFTFRFNRRFADPFNAAPLIARHRGRHLCSNLCRALLGRVAAPYM